MTKYIKVIESKDLYRFELKLNLLLLIGGEIKNIGRNDDNYFAIIEIDEQSNSFKNIDYDSYKLIWENANKNGIDVSTWDEKEIHLFMDFFHPLVYNGQKWR